MPHANGLGPIADMCPIQLKASRHIAYAIFAGAEKIDRLVLHAAQPAVIEQIRFIKPRPVPPSVERWLKLQTNLFCRPETSWNDPRENLHAFKGMQSDNGKTILQYAEQTGFDSSPILPNQLKKLAPSCGRACSIH